MLFADHDRHYASTPSPGLGLLLPQCVQLSDGCGGVPFHLDHGPELVQALQ